jgi:hypothetical protein
VTEKVTKQSPSAFPGFVSTRPAAEAPPGRQDQTSTPLDTASPLTVVVKQIHMEGPMITIPIISSDQSRDGR